MYSRTDCHGCPHPCRVTEAARDRLQRSPYPIVRRLSCEYQGGVLILRGRVPSFYYKQLAQETVTGIEGVSQVVNETEVLASLY